MATKRMLRRGRRWANLRDARSFRAVRPLTATPRRGRPGGLARARRLGSGGRGSLLDPRTPWEGNPPWHGNRTGSSRRRLASVGALAGASALGRPAGGGVLRRGDRAAGVARAPRSSLGGVICACCGRCGAALAPPPRGFPSGCGGRALRPRDYGGTRLSACSQDAGVIQM